MRILIVIPPSPFLTDDRVFPFLGPLQIAALAVEDGHSVRVTDLTGYSRRNPTAPIPSLENVLQESWGILSKDVQEFSPDIVGFHASMSQRLIVTHLLKRLREVSSAVTLVGGPHANTAPHLCRKDGFDYIVMSDQGGGGGETSFRKTLDLVSQRGHGPGGVTVLEPSRLGAKWENDRWPFPARHLIDLDSYRYEIQGERATSVVTMAGCPFSCAYCCHWPGYRQQVGKSPEKVEKEIQLIKREYGYRGIMFYDDEVNLRPGFRDEFLPMLKRQDVVWRGFFKTGRNLMGEGLFREMADAGCRVLCTGTESADPGILRTIHKGSTVEDNTDFIRKCVRYGIEPTVFAQAGLPGENPESIKRLRDWAVAMVDEGLKHFTVSITTPFPGSPIFEDSHGYDISFDRSEIENSLAAYKVSPGTYKSWVWNSSMTREQIVEARQWVEDEFNRALKR